MAYCKCLVVQHACPSLTEIRGMWEGERGGRGGKGSKGNLLVQGGREREREVE